MGQGQWSQGSGGSPVFFAYTEKTFRVKQYIFSTSKSPLLVREKESLDPSGRMQIVYEAMLLV